jgi:TRAP-type uncharacterized transport system substrate-binding protein
MLYHARGRPHVREPSLHPFLTVCAIVLAILSAAVGVSYVALRPSELRIAIPAANPLDKRLFGAAAEMLRAQRAPVRVETITSESTKAALDALEAGSVDLAVVSSDAAMQGRAHSVMVMRREVAVMIAPKAGPLQKTTDLPNVTIGLARVGPLDAGLLRQVLDYYGIAQDGAKYVSVPVDEVAEAIRQKKIDGIIAVGTLASKKMTDVIAEVARGADGAIQFVDFEEADAIAKRIPALEAIEVDQGAFGGRPPRPGESFHAIGYSIRLIATPDTDKNRIAELVRHLYLLRQNLSVAVAGAGLMAVPDTDEATGYLIHPGVRAYVDGEQQNWFERYSDYIYLAMFAATGIGSVVVALLSRMNGDATHDPLQRIQAAFEAACGARTREAVDAAEREADEVFRSVFGTGAGKRLPENGMVRIGVAMSELRNRIAAQRAALAVKDPE